MNYQEESELSDILDTNIAIKSSLETLLEQIEQIEEQDLEDRLLALIANMLNFFSDQIETIPNFNSLSDKQKNILLLKIKAIAKDAKLKKFSNPYDLANNLTISVLTIIETQTIRKQHENFNDKNLHTNQQLLKLKSTLQEFNISNDLAIKKKPNIHHTNNLTKTISIKKGL
jgi:hypothetical protein